MGFVPPVLFISFPLFYHAHAGKVNIKLDLPARKICDISAVVGPLFCYKK